MLTMGGILTKLRVLTMLEMFNMKTVLNLINKKNVKGFASNCYNFRTKLLKKHADSDGVEYIQYLTLLTALVWMTYRTLLTILVWITYRILLTYWYG
jgi:hypothetical protein